MLQQTTKSTAILKKKLKDMRIYSPQRLNIPKQQQNKRQRLHQHDHDLQSYFLNVYVFFPQETKKLTQIIMLMKSNLDYQKFLTPKKNYKFDRGFFFEK